MTATGEPGDEQATPRRSRLWERFRSFAIVVGCIAGLLAIVSYATNFFGGREGSGLPDVRIDVAQSLLDAPGYDDPSAEYVCLVNASKGTVSLAGWQLRDANGLVNELPQHQLAAHGRVRVHPGPGADNRADLYGEARRPAWNNSGGTIVLVDEHGRHVARADYPTQHEKGAAYTSCGPGPAP